MTESGNRENESSEGRNVQFSRDGTESRPAEVETAAGEEPATTGEGHAEEKPDDAEDLSRYERLRRFFSRRRSKAAAPEVSGEAAAETAPPEESGEELPETSTATVEDPPVLPPQPAEPAPPETAGTGPDLPAREESDTAPAIEAVAEKMPQEEEPKPGITAGEAAPETAAGEMPAPAAEPAVESAPVSRASEPPPEKPATEQRFGRIRRALSKTGKGLGRVFLGQKQIDDELLEELETQLLTADLGFEVTTEVIDELTERVRRRELDDVDALRSALKGLLVEILKPCEMPLTIEGGSPFVLMTVGVNGVGKTTTIGKLAKLFLSDDKSVMLAAGDTFRAAAVEQLQVWGERNGVPVVAQHTGADSASVIYDAVESARAREMDLLIADTAGRLHTKSNLMDELKKIKRVLGKLDESAPHEVLLVLDAGTGQNAVNQLTQFHEAVGITGIVLTKLDGTAKGGVIFALCRKYGIPVRYIGVGESVDDLQPFRAEDFVDALLASADTAETESAPG